MATILLEILHKPRITVRMQFGETPYLAVSDDGAVILTYFFGGISMIFLNNISLISAPLTIYAIILIIFIMSILQSAPLNDHLMFYHSFIIINIADVILSFQG